MSTLDSVVSAMRYRIALEETNGARHQRDYAGAHLDLCQIRERLAEIESQHEPLASLLDAKMGERERLCAAAFYVVIGRMPPIAAAPSGAGDEEEGK